MRPARKFTQTHRRMESGKNSFKRSQTVQPVTVNKASQPKVHPSTTELAASIEDLAAFVDVRTGGGWRAAPSTRPLYEETAAHARHPCETPHKLRVRWNRKWRGLAAKKNTSHTPRWTCAKLGQKMNKRRYSPKLIAWRILWWRAMVMLIQVLHFINSGLDWWI